MGELPKTVDDVSKYVFYLFESQARKATGKNIM